MGDDSPGGWLILERAFVQFGLLACLCGFALVVLPLLAADAAGAGAATRDSPSVLFPPSIFISETTIFVT